jgi:hypothetical protein
VLVVEEKIAVELVEQKILVELVDESKIAI